MSYDDYAKRHEAQSKEFIAATFTAISDYERVIADPNAKATDVALARDALGRAMRAMGVDADIARTNPDVPDLNRDANALQRISAIASTVAPMPADPGHCHNNVAPRSLGEIAADVMNKAFDEQFAGAPDGIALSEKALEQAVIDIHEMCDESGAKIAVKPTKVWYPYDGREI